MRWHVYASSAQEPEETRSGLVADRLDWQACGLVVAD